MCQARIENINKELMILLKNAGCEFINVGVETGNEWLRRKVLNRQISNEQTINAFKIIKDVDLNVAAYYMIGLPFETPEMIEEGALEDVLKICVGYLINESGKD